MLLALPLAACSVKKSRMDTTTEMDSKQAENQAVASPQQDEIRLQKMRLTGQEQEELMAGRLNNIVADDDVFPPDARPGECYARIFVPHKMQTVTEQVLVQEASEKIEIIPAKYETVTERVILEEVSQRLETIPAEYSMVEDEIMVEPAKTEIIDVPATYETVTEKILIKPAHVAWKKGTGPIQRIDQATGEIMCLVEIPAEYKTVSKRVLKTPATTKTVEAPPEYITIKRRVMTKAPTTKVVEIPAKYRTVEVIKLVTPARDKRIKIPAEYKTVTKQQVLEPGHMEWRPILCETNMTSSRISDIQAALEKKGFDPGPIDGVIGISTMAAVNEFQKKNGLLVSEYLTLSTLEALGIDPGK